MLSIIMKEQDTQKLEHVHVHMDVQKVPTNEWLRPDQILLLT